MKWIGITASTIGILFGSVVGIWIFIVAAGIGLDAHPDPSALPWSFVPLLLIAASVVGWKFPRMSGWGLIGGGVAVAILMVCLRVRQIADFLVVLPMLVPGALWVWYSNLLSETVTSQKWSGVAASTIKWSGVAASTIGLLFGVGGGVWSFMFGSSFGSFFLLLLGPLSLAVAAIVGWKFPRVAGWWLMGGGVAVALVVALRTTFGNLLQYEPLPPGAIYKIQYLMESLGYPVVLPMLASGALWVWYSKVRRDVTA